MTLNSRRRNASGWGVRGELVRYFIQLAYNSFAPKPSAQVMVPAAKKRGGRLYVFELLDANDGPLLGGVGGCDAGGVGKPVLDVFQKNHSRKHGAYELDDLSTVERQVSAREGLHKMDGIC
jgi:hypothetical protein